MWISLRAQDVGGRKVIAGDPVPEAANWPNREAWIKFGYIAWVPDPDNTTSQLTTEPPLSLPPTPEAAPVVERNKKLEIPRRKKRTAQ